MCFVAWSVGVPGDWSVSKKKNSERLAVSGLSHLRFPVKINRGYYVVTQGYEFYLLVLKVSLTSE